MNKKDLNSINKGYNIFLKQWIQELKRVKKTMKRNDNHWHWYLRQGEIDILISLFKNIIG